MSHSTRNTLEGIEPAKQSLYIIKLKAADDLQTNPSKRIVHYGEAIELAVSMAKNYNVDQSVDLNNEWRVKEAQTRKKLYEFLLSQGNRQTDLEANTTFLLAKENADAIAKIYLKMGDDVTEWQEKAVDANIRGLEERYNYFFMKTIRSIAENISFDAASSKLIAEKIAVLYQDKYAIKNNSKDLEKKQEWLDKSKYNYESAIKMARHSKLQADNAALREKRRRRLTYPHMFQRESISSMTESASAKKKEIDFVITERDTYYLGRSITGRKSK
jgi:hypothetical protein